MISPLHFLILSLLITILAVFIQRFIRWRDRRALQALARQWGMHYAPDDRFRIADAVAQRFPVPGAADVRVEQVSGLPTLTVRIDHAAAALYGLSAADVSDALATGLGGTATGKIFEGDRRYSERSLQGPGRVVRPALVYGRDDGCSITGGHVYRGRAIPTLVGTYVYGDFCEPALKAVRRTASGVTDPRPLGVEVEGVASFALDADGELLVLSLSGEVSRLVAR